MISQISLNVCNNSEKTLSSVIIEWYFYKEKTDSSGVETIV